MAAILKLLFFALNGLFGDGTISYLFQGLESYHHAKFHAFKRKWTIQAHICSTNLEKTSYAASTLPSPPSPAITHLFARITA